MSLFEKGVVNTATSGGKNIAIVDLSVVVHTTAFGVFDKSDHILLENGKSSLHIDTFRPAIIGSILHLVNLHQNNDEVIIAVDAPPYWRKDIIPYKVARKIAKHESDFDVGYIYQYLDDILDDIRKYLPWKVIKIARMEADDVIAVLGKKHSAENNNVIIYSSDTDLCQLQKYKGIKQYSPFTKKFIGPKDSAENDLLDKMIRGDAKDSVPNIYTDSMFFQRKVDVVLGGGKFAERQKPVTKKLITEAIEANWLTEVFCDTADMIANFERNRLLVDLDLIPAKYQEECINTYNDTKHAGRARIMTLLSKYRMAALFDKISTF